MIHKEEDTVVLLSPIDVEEEPRKENSHRRSFSASGISSSFLCGAGIFIANTVVWCRDSRENCKDSELFRFTALFGGIISSLIVGRAVDYYGRRSSLVFSALFWIVVTVFMVFLPSQTEIHVNSYDAPLSKFYIWPTEFRSPSIEFAPAYTIKAYDTQVSVSHIISYSYSQNSSLDNHFFPTQPTPIKSLSLQNYGYYLNADLATNDNQSVKNFPSSKSKMLEYSSLKPVNSILNLNRNSFLIPFFIFHLFLGSASSSSIVAASVYIYETSPSNYRAQWLALADFFSSLFIFCLPVIRGHLILLATSAWLPIIALGFLMLIPITIPDYLSLPNSPHFLLLSVFIQRRNLLFSNSVISHSDKSKGVSVPSKEPETKHFSSVFQTYGNATLGYIKIPFKKAKLKIHDSSSKSSASDSDDSSYFLNDTVKQVVLETKHELLLPVERKNEEETESIHYQQFDVAFPGGVNDYSYAAHVEDVSEVEKSLGSKAKCYGDPEESDNLIECAVEDCEEEYSCQVASESNETQDVFETQGEHKTLGQQNWSESRNPSFSWQERESVRILSYLNGKREGYLEWKNIKKMLKEDIPRMNYSAKNTFFHLDCSRFCSILYLVTKVGLPLVIIHMFSCEYGAVNTLSETIVSKLGFCDLSGPATITFVQVVSSGISVLILDKLRSQVVLKSAAVVMTSSLIILGFLLPSIQNMVGGEQLSISRNAVTPNPALPTLYPLLPTPLPQVLLGQENICSDNLLESSPSQAWGQVGIAHNIQKGIPLNSSIIWFAAIVIVTYVFVSSLVLLPLTRLVLVSYFPIDKRGSGVGISISIQWVFRLVMIFFPHSFLNSGLGFLLYAAISFSSILMLCLTSNDFFSKDSFFHQTKNGKRISHRSSRDKICNLSDVNSTAV